MISDKLPFQIINETFLFLWIFYETQRVKHARSLLFYKKGAYPWSVATKTYSLKKNRIVPLHALTHLHYLPLFSKINEWGPEPLNQFKQQKMLRMFWAALMKSSNLWVQWLECFMNPTPTCTSLSQSAFRPKSIQKLWDQMWGILCLSILVSLVCRHVLFFLYTNN